MSDERHKQIELGFGLEWTPMEDDADRLLGVPDDVSRAQRLHFELLLEASGSTFDARKVVADLISNRRLWRGVVMDRAAFVGLSPPESGFAIDLIKLRDIERGWNVNTLYILSSGEDDAELLRVTSSWRANEMSWISGDEARQMLSGEAGARILQVWWD